MRASKTLGIIAALLLLLSACGGDDDDPQDPGAAASDPTDEPADDETTDDDDPPSEDDDATDDDPDEKRGDIGESMVGGIAQPYGAGPIVDGEVKVYFNNGTSGKMVAIYHGPGLSDPTDLCPGNSLSGANGFEFISNAPASPGACDGFPTDRGSVRVCDKNVWLYQTMIPNDSTGQVYGSLETRLADGTISGQTAVAENKPSTPEIDFDADVYDITAMFTSDGSTEITCNLAIA